MTMSQRKLLEDYVGNNNYTSATSEYELLEKAIYHMRYFDDRVTNFTISSLDGFTVVKIAITSPICTLPRIENRDVYKAKLNAVIAAIITLNEPEKEKNSCKCKCDSCSCNSDSWKEAYYVLAFYANRNGFHRFESKKKLEEYASYLLNNSIVLLRDIHLCAKVTDVELIEEYHLEPNTFPLYLEYKAVNKAL